MLTPQDDRNWWSAFGNEGYSWEEYAKGRGYPTLAIDRPGNGASSHRSDPVTMLQAPYEMEILNQLINTLRGPRSPIPAFKRLVYVGHSYGSIIGNRLAIKYPSAVDAYILTGLAVPKPEDNAFIGEFETRLGPASKFNPTSISKRYLLGRLRHLLQ